MKYCEQRTFCLKIKIDFYPLEKFKDQNTLHSSVVFDNLLVATFFILLIFTKIISI